MKFIIGIGNPEAKYRETRHNIGFRVADGLASNWSGRTAGKISWRHEDALKADVHKPQEDVLILKPRTYVNLTGRTALQLKDRFSAKPADVLVVCDDVNLVFGKLRLRASGSAGGHHGLEDVIKELGSEEFPRLRIGVRNEETPPDLTDFVLGRFGQAEEKILPEILNKVSSVCKAWALEGYGAAEKILSQLQSNQ